MIDPLASDVAVTWLGAAGCALYAHFLWQQRAAGFAARAACFLMVMLAWVLFVRGFYWLWESAVLGRAVFAGATLLPLAITLFTEGALRRHHPRWLKLAALAASALFAVANLFFDLADSPRLLAAFCASLAGIAGANAVFLLAAGAVDLSRNERLMARAIVACALIAIPLIVTDFRETLGGIPVRAGAIGALLFVCVHAGLSDQRSVVAPLTARFFAALGAALALAASFALAIVGLQPELPSAAAQAFPLAFAWVLLTLATLRVRAASLEGRDVGFLRWLAHARLDSAAGFLSSLKWLPQTRDHVILESSMLRDYAVDEILALVGREPASLADARSWIASGQAGRMEVGEQLRDLLERHGMTHALLVAAEPPLIVLLNLPAGAQSAVGELRATVIQHLARRLAKS